MYYLWYEEFARQARDWAGSNDLKLPYHGLSIFMVESTPSPPTKSFDFRGFDSSKILILKGGNSHVR